MAKNYSQSLEIKKAGKVIAAEDEIVQFISKCRGKLYSTWDCQQALVKEFKIPMGTAQDKVKCYVDKYENFTEETQKEMISSMYSTLKSIYKDLDVICDEFHENKDRYAEATIIKIKLDVVKTFGKHFVGEIINHQINTDDSDKLKNALFEHYGKNHQIKKD